MIELSQEHKVEYISRMTEELLVLRAKAGFTQERLSNYIGISRQTYNAMETGQRRMSWSTFLSLVFIYDSIPETSRILRKLEVFPDGLLEQLNRRGSASTRETDLNKLN